MTRARMVAAVPVLLSVLMFVQAPATADPIDDMAKSVGDQASLALERVAQARSEYTAVSTRAAEVRARLTAARERQAELQGQIDTVRDRFRVHVRGLFRTDASGLGQLALLLGAESPAELIEGATLLEVTASHQNELLRTMSTEASRVEMQAEETRRLADSLAELEGRARTALERAAAEQLIVNDLVVQLQRDLAMRDAARAAAAGGLGGIPAQLPVPAGECQGGLVASYPNGLIPTSLLCPLLGSGQRLRADAAAAFNRMSRSYAVQFGTPTCVSSGYRSFDEQAVVKQARGSLAAAPGRSNHGWGLAVDLCDGINTFGTAQHNWMRTYAPVYGFYLPGWAQQGGSKPEPWHWEFAGSGARAAGVPFMPPGAGDSAPPEDEAEPVGPAPADPPALEPAPPPAPQPPAPQPPAPPPAPVDPGPQEPTPQPPSPPSPSPPSPSPTDPASPEPTPPEPSP